MESYFVNPEAYINQEKVLFSPEVLAEWQEEQRGLGRRMLPILVHHSLLLRNQDDWLKKENLTVKQLLDGDYPAGIDDYKVRNAFFKPWNEILVSNGLKPQFPEEDATQSMLGSIGENLGVDAIQIEDGEILRTLPNPGVERTPDQVLQNLMNLSDDMVDELKNSYSEPLPEPAYTTQRVDDFWQNKATLQQLRKQAKFLGLKNYSRHKKSILKGLVIRTRRKRRKEATA